MGVLYNEIEPFACDWLENLIEAGCIARGRVDRRSIVDVEPWMLEDATQFHAFAGIAGWSYALRLAGWPDGVECWSGSVPCQGFSSAGKRRGFDDERHLWPEFYRLIKACRPAIIFGEQVASSDVVGKVRPKAEEETQRTWIDLVSADLEKASYAFGFVVLPACSVGAPHIRQHLFWVAYRDGKRLDRIRLQLRKGRSEKSFLEAPWCRASRRLANGDGRGRAEGEASSSEAGESRAWSRDVRHVRGLGDSSGERSGRNAGEISREETRGKGERLEARGVADELELASPARGFWGGCDWIPCQDGKWRSAQSGIFPLADGVPGRVGTLRGAGNAVVAPLAAAFIETVIDLLVE
jgi:DNA (cytosine-5)-methyltransferase 1